MAQAEYNYSGSGFGNRFTQNMPAYKQPKYDQEKIGLYTQQQMLPGLAKLRRGFQSSTGGYTENPAERDMMLRQLMAGYGQGLGDLQLGATRAAQGLYSQEYSGLENQAMRDYERGMNQWDIWRKEQTGMGGLRDPRGPHPPSYSSWEEYDRAVATQRPTGTTSYTNLPLSGSGGGMPRGLPASGPGERFGVSTPTPTGYGAGSEEAYKRAIREGGLATGGYSKTERVGANAKAGLQGWDLGGGKTGLSLLGRNEGFNPYE